MSLQGTYRKLYGRFKFNVNIQNVPFAGFQSCSAVKLTIGQFEYREGGALVAYKEPALANFEDVTLARGVSHNLHLWNWVLEVCDVMAKLPGGVGVKSPGYKRNVTINQTDRDDSVAIRWKLFWAWPKDYEASEFDNNAEEVSLETLVLAYHHADREDLATT
jgi:phage tail-like protein